MNDLVGAVEKIPGNVAENGSWRTEMTARAVRHAGRSEIAER